MLLQSHSDVINLSPALPDVWNKGAIKGLKARGNFTVDVVWNNGLLTNAEIKGTAGSIGKYKIPGDEVKTFEIPANGIFSINNK